MKYLKSWTRVKVFRRRLSLWNAADRTGNHDMLRLLDKFRNTNEFVMAVMACDGPIVRDFLALKSGK